MTAGIVSAQITTAQITTAQITTAQITTAQHMLYTCAAVKNMCGSKVMNMWGRKVMNILTMSTLVYSVYFAYLKVKFELTKPILTLPSLTYPNLP
jgi:hypothetical protein